MRLNCKKTWLFVMMFVTLLTALPQIALAATDDFTLTVKEYRNRTQLTWETEWIGAIPSLSSWNLAKNKIHIQPKDLSALGTTEYKLFFVDVQPRPHIRYDSEDNSIEEIFNELDVYCIATLTFDAEKRTVTINHLKDAWTPWHDKSYDANSPRYDNEVSQTGTVTLTLDDDGGFDFVDYRSYYLADMNPFSEYVIATEDDGFGLHSEVCLSNRLIIPFGALETIESLDADGNGSLSEPFSYSQVLNDTNFRLDPKAKNTTVLRMYINGRGGNAGELFYKKYELRRFDNNNFGQNDYKVLMRATWQLNQDNYAHFKVEKFDQAGTVIAEEQMQVPINPNTYTYKEESPAIYADYTYEKRGQFCSYEDFMDQSDRYGCYQVAVTAEVDLGDGPVENEYSSRCEVRGGISQSFSALCDSEDKPMLYESSSLLPQNKRAYAVGFNLTPRYNAPIADNYKSLNIYKYRMWRVELDENDQPIEEEVYLNDHTYAEFYVNGVLQKDPEHNYPLANEALSVSFPSDEEQLNFYDYFTHRALSHGESFSMRYRVRLYYFGPKPWKAPHRGAIPTSELPERKFNIDEKLFKVTFSKDGVVTAIEDIDDNLATPVSITYYNTLGVASSTPWPGVNIQRQTMTDGTVVTTKVMH